MSCWQHCLYYFLKRVGLSMMSLAATGALKGLIDADIL
jgi:hypothetical protein